MDTLLVEETTVEDGNYTTHPAMAYSVLRFWSDLSETLNSIIGNRDYSLPGRNWGIIEEAHLG